MLLKQPPQLIDQFLAGVAMCPRAQNALRRVEQVGRRDALERAFLLDPHLRLVHHAHRGPRPIAPEVGLEALGVEPVGDLGFEQVAFDEPAVDLVHDSDFFMRAGLQDHVVGLQALVLAARKLALHRAGLVDQHTPQAVARWPTLPEAQLDQTALPGEHLLHNDLALEKRPPC